MLLKFEFWIREGVPALIAFALTLKIAIRCGQQQHEAAVWRQ